MTRPIVVVGDALIDEIESPDGSSEFIGGAALNVAVGVARLGAPAQLIAMVGDDEPGERIRAFLAEHGVELIATTGPLGTSRAVSRRTPDGEPYYEFNAAAKNRRVEFGEAERAAIAGASVVAVSCFPFDDAEQTNAFYDAVAASDAEFVVDPNPRSDMLTDAAEFVRGFERFAPISAVIKVGDDDAELLYGIPLDDLVQRLRDAGAKTVLATRGKDGATLFAEGAEPVHRGISSMPGPIVDTMGGGDATLASFIASIALDPEIEGEVALQRAMDVAAATVRHEGALLRTP